MEYAHSINGVSGRMFERHAHQNGLYSSQTWKASRPISGWGNGAMLTVCLRFDDGCRNRHQSFAITSNIKLPKAHDIEAGGCLHDEIAKVFPELAPLIKWHLFDTTGPMHYIANTVYLAGDRDYNGLRKGEQRQIRNGKTGQLCWQLTGDKLPQYVDSDTCPEAKSTYAYVPWMKTGEGKERQLDAARMAAVWPEAPDEILTAEPEILRAALIERLPALIADFRKAMESCGFEWRELSAEKGAA
jgi:hypothetical protein